MFGIGSTELLLILVVALVVLGPKSLAGVSRSLGKAVGEFRRVSTEFQRTLNVEVAQEEMREKAKTGKDAGASAAAPFAKAAETARQDDSGIPEDSPLGQALAKAKAQAAEAAEKSSPASTPGPRDTHVS